MRKKEWIVLLTCILCIGCSLVFSFGEDCVKIRENTLRLHILANSDSDEDQALKLKIRDAILSQSGELFSGSQNREQVIASAKENIEKIEEIARQTAQDNGYDIKVQAKVADMFFETRQYDKVILPAGTYTAVRVELGEAKGKNWWCVLYPPLCVQAAEAGFTDEEAQICQSLLQEDELPKYKVKLAMVEWWENLWKNWSR